MNTLLARRAQKEIPIATNDQHQATMTADPTIPQFPNDGSAWTGQSLSDNSSQSTHIQQLNTDASDVAAQNAEVLVKHDKESSDWINKKWRPMMAVMYMMVCIFDFIGFPIMYTIVQFWETQASNDAFRQWQPLTLLGGGLFHVAMGAVLGIAAFGRSQEKIAGRS